MALDPTAAQAAWISKFRADLGQVLTTLSTLDSDRLRASAMGGVDAFQPAAFASASNGPTNVDLQAADLDAALASLVKLRAVLIDGTGNPTADALAIAKVAR